MAKAYITMHSVARRDFPAMSSGETIAALGGHQGDSIDLDFSNGVQSTGLLAAGLYEISIVGAAARIAIGPNAAATEANGQYWSDGRCTVRFVRQGEKISVVAAT